MVSVCAYRDNWRPLANRGKPLPVHVFHSFAKDIKTTSIYLLWSLSSNQTMIGNSTVNIF